MINRKFLSRSAILVVFFLGVYLYYSNVSNVTNCKDIQTIPPVFEYGSITFNNSTYVLDRSDLGHNGESFVLKLPFKLGALELLAESIDDEDIVFSSNLFLNLLDGTILQTDTAIITETENGSEGTLEISATLNEENGFSMVMSATVPLLLGGAGDSELLIDDTGTMAHLYGTLGLRTYKQISNLIENHSKVSTIVFVDVPGSVNDEVNMETGRLIRLAGLNTLIADEGQASSGGVDLFVSGVKRSIGEGGKLGVHSWSNGESEAKDLPEDHPGHQQQICYFNEMLDDPIGRNFYFYTIYAAPFDDIHWMTVDEITQYGVATE